MQLQFQPFQIFDVCFKSLVALTKVAPEQVQLLLLSAAALDRLPEPNFEYHPDRRIVDVASIVGGHV